MNTHHLTAGVLCGMGAGALWGLVFLAPQLLHDFGPLHLSAARYLLYGLMAATLLAPRWRRVSASLGARHWWQLHGLALVGNSLYYVLLCTGVQQGGIAMTSLVIGFLPVAVTVIGIRAQGALPLRVLAPSLLMCVAGALFISAESLLSTPLGGGANPTLGLLAAVGALASWTTFAVANARCLQGLPGVSAQDWNLLTGVATGLQSLALLPLAWWLEPATHTLEAWSRFAVVSLAVAGLASIVGNALWNRMSRVLPLTLVGQMILFETLFALLYGFAWEQRWPTALETGALCCVVLGVVLCMRAHRPTAPTH